MRFLADLLFMFSISAAALTAGPVIIKANGCSDGKSDRVTTPGLVVVVAGKIQGTGVDAAGAGRRQVIDLGDATLLPGFMDAHTHLVQEASDDWKQDRLDRRERPFRTGAGCHRICAEDVDAGFTTVRDVGSSDYRCRAAQRHSRSQDRRAGACWWRSIQSARPAAL